MSRQIRINPGDGEEELVATLRKGNEKSEVWDIADTAGDVLMQAELFRQKGQWHAWDTRYPRQEQRIIARLLAQARNTENYEVKSLKKDRVTMAHTMSYGELPTGTLVYDSIRKSQKNLMQVERHNPIGVVLPGNTVRTTKPTTELRYVTNKRLMAVPSNLEVPKTFIKRMGLGVIADQGSWQDIRQQESQAAARQQGRNPAAEFEFYSHELSNMILDAIKTGDKEEILNIRALWDDEPWESIVRKFNTEGSAWVVWWQDGVNAYAKWQREE